MYGESVLDVLIGAREAAQHWHAGGPDPLIMGRSGGMDPAKRVTTTPEESRTPRKGSHPGSWNIFASP